MLQDPSPYYDEMFTLVPDPDPPSSVTSLDLSDGDGYRGFGSQVNTAPQTFRHPEDPAMSLDLPPSHTLYSQTLDRRPRVTMEGMYPSSTLPRTYGSQLPALSEDRRYRSPYAAQPQVPGSSRPERYLSEPHMLQDDPRALGYEGLTFDPSGGAYDGQAHYLRSRSLEDPMGEPHVAQRPPPGLPEAVSLLSSPAAGVQANAAAYLQHLCFRDPAAKAEVRRAKGIPALVSLLEHPSPRVQAAACGVLRNLAFGRDTDNKKAVRDCEGVPALGRLLRRARDPELNEVITGTLWNLSSHDVVKEDIVRHSVEALCDEVLSPHSGWDRDCPSRGKGLEAEWRSVLTNTAGCLRNVSSEKREARQRLRECAGLVDSLFHIVRVEMEDSDVNSKLMENCVCVLRNLSFQVHREIPESGQYQEPAGEPTHQARAGCFGMRGKGKKVNEGASVDVEIPRRSTPAKGYELLYQPEVVRLYLSLIRECSNPAVLEAAAGAIQNLCAGRWMYGRYIRAAVRQEKGLSNIAERLMHDNDRVVKAVSGALRNLALDERNKELIGKHAMLNLIHALPSMAQGKGSKSLAEDTVVSVLQTLNELLVDNVEAARRLREQQGVERLVGIIRSGTHSDREMKASSAVLQTLWHHRELRKPLQNDGWKKADFQHLSSTQNPTESAFDDSTLPLIDKSQRAGDKREMIPMNDMGPDSYNTVDNRDPTNTHDDTGESLGWETPDQFGKPTHTDLGGPAYIYQG